jgi:DNA polymerase III delta subunit
MRLDGFFFACGDDSDMIERKWLTDISSRYADQTWLRLDATIDDINVASLVTEYYTNNLFGNGKVLFIRNADHKHAQVAGLIEQLLDKPLPDNALILIGNSWNKTTKFGKLIKKHFVVREFEKPEIKPFDLLDSLNTKNATKVLHCSNRLFEADYNPLAVFSLIFGHLLLLRQVKEREGQLPETIAREIKQHQFRVKKAMVANKFWTTQEINTALKTLSRLDKLLRTWQYDEKMLIQMTLIKLCV